MTENIEVLLQALKRGDAASRIEAAQTIAYLEKSSEEIVRELEWVVVSDPSRAVQEAALAALATPVHHRIHRRLTPALYERRTILIHVDQWVADGLITPQIAALLKGRYAPEPPPPPKPKPVIPPQKQEVVIRPPGPEPVRHREPAAPIAPIKKKPELFEGEIEGEGDQIVEEPLLEKQKFSLMGTFTSETTIKIALYLGAFLIVSAAVLFAYLVEPARFAMLTLTLLGFMTASRVTFQRLPLGSTVLFVIGTLLIPIDAAIFFELINTHASLLDWSVVAAGMTLVWAWGTNAYQSRLFSLAAFATFSVAVYLAAASFMAIESAGFLLVVSLVALAGLGETSLLRRWQGDDFAEPVFSVVQLQALGVLVILGATLVSRIEDLFAWVVDEHHFAASDSQAVAMLGAWLTLGVFYFASDQITRRWKQWDLPVFPVLVTVCLMTPPIFLIEVISANPHQIAAILWGWGVLTVLAAEAFHGASAQWMRPYALWFLYASLLFLVTAPLVEYVTTSEYAAGYFLGTGVVYFLLTYRRKDTTLWFIALIATYLAYLVGFRALSTGESAAATAAESSVTKGFVLLVPALVFLSVELAGRRHFRATPPWTVPPLLLGLFSIVWDVGLLLSSYNDHPGSAAIIFLIYGAFGALYAALDDQRERGQATVGWTAGLIAVYAAYIYVLPNVSKIEFGGYMLLAPALVFLSTELAGKRYFQAGPSWTRPLLGLGLFNVGLDVLVTLVGGLDSYTGSAAIVFLIYGLFGALYAVLDMRFERDYATTAWTAGLIALYTAYGFVYRLPAIQDLDIFPGFVLLLPMLIFLSAELVGKLHFRLSRFWTLPLLGAGLFNAALVVLVTLNGRLDHPDSAVIIFLIYGLFAVLYAKLDVQLERDYAVIAWTAGLIALYAAYGSVYRLLEIQDLDIFPGYFLLLPMLVFLSADLAGKLHFRASESWTLPLFGLGLLSAALVVPVTLHGGLNHDASGSAAIVFLIYGLFAVLYAKLDVRLERDYAVIAWTAGLIALYAAYAFVYRLPAIQDLNIFPGYFLLLPALVFLSAELVGKIRFRASESWALPLFGLGLFNAALVVPVTLGGGLGDHPGSAAINFLIYGLFAVLYTKLDVQFERDYAVMAWTAGLIALYTAYGFVFRLPAIQDLNIFPGYFLLLPALVFLSAELLGKIHFRANEPWTLPLFGLGLVSAALVVPVTLHEGLNNDASGSAAIVFLIYGLFAVLYSALDVQYQRDYAVIAWDVGLIALYVSYGFIYLLPAIEREDYFPGFALLVPALVFLSAELVGRRYFRASESWTFPLLALGLLNAALVVPAAFDGGLDGHAGSAAIVFLIYGLYGALYIVLLDLRSEIGYGATGSIALALAFALRSDDQAGWVLPFVALALLYYLGGVAVRNFTQRRDWSQVLRWSGLALGTATALSAPLQGGGDAVVGMGVIGTLYGAEAFRRRNVWLGLPANGLFLGAYLLALQELHVTDPQFYSIGTGLLAIVTHYFLTRRSKEQAAFVIGFAMGVTAQVILLGTSFIQMSTGLQQFFFLLFFQSLILLAYGLVIHSLSFTIVPILFVVGGVLRVVFTLLASYSTVLIIGGTGLALVLLGITALIMRERLMRTYAEFQRTED